MYTCVHIVLYAVKLLNTNMDIDFWIYSIEGKQKYYFLGFFIPNFIYNFSFVNVSACYLYW